MRLRFDCSLWNLRRALRDNTRKQANRSGGNNANAKGGPKTLNLATHSAESALLLEAKHIHMIGLSRLAGNTEDLCNIRLVSKYLYRPERVVP
jgi:hypothetical protein